MMGMGKDRERTSARRRCLGSGSVPTSRWPDLPDRSALDLADASDSSGRIAGISVALAAFVVLYFALLPPQMAPSARRVGNPGRTPAPGTDRRVAARARSSALVCGLFVFVVAAGGILLSSVEAGAVTAITAAAVGIGLAATGSDGSTVAAYTLTVVAVGTIMITLGAMVRANRDLRAAREELARAAVSEERLRIARDLHDLLGHTLSLITLKSQLAAKLVETDAREHASSSRMYRRSRAKRWPRCAKPCTYRLRSVAEAIEGARTTLAAADRLPRRLHVRRAPAEVESVLAWAVREASTNVVRHSGAHVCAITLVRGAAGVSLQIDDDGSGAGGSATGSASRAGRSARLLHDAPAGAGPEGFRLRLNLPLRAT